MQVKVTAEHGYEQAIKGLGFSFKERSEDTDAWFERMRPKLESRAAKLAHRHGGHNKFLESIMLWIEVEAPRSFWSQFDTYRLATKQSESTMHTLLNRRPTIDDFEQGTPYKMIDSFIRVWFESKELPRDERINVIKLAMPEGYLQRRMICLSYKTMQNIINQRMEHKLSGWAFFIDSVIEQVEHPEFLVS